MQHAAQLSGVDSEQLSTGLGFLLKNMADAANGGKETGAAFAALGLNAKDLINLPTDQAMGMIADKLNAIQNPALRAGAAVKIFGKAGQNLLPLLAEGSSGLSEMTDDAASLGLSFSRVDAKKVEEANDAVTRFKNVFQGIANQIAIAISPAIKIASDYLTSLGIIVIGGIKAIIPKVLAFGSRIAQTFQSIYAAIQPTLISTWNVVQVVFSGIVNVVTSLSGTLFGVVQSVWAGIYGVVAPIVGNILNVVASNWQAIALTVIEVGQGIFDFLSATWGLVYELASRVWAGVTAVWGWGASLIGVQTTDAATTVTVRSA